MIKNEFIFGWSMLALAVLSNTGASIALKWANQSRQQLDSVFFFSSLTGMVALAAALTCYAVAFFAYMMTLRVLPVSIAYPMITSITVVFITLAAYFLFKEPITVKTVLGTLFVLAGVTVLMGGAK